MPTVLIATDGSGTSSGPGGWAAVLRFGDAELEISGSVAEATNNRMEIRAAIEALAALSRPCAVEVTTDSEYLKNGATLYLGGWKRFGWKTTEGNPIKNRDLWERLDVEIQRHQVVWVHVKGHTGHPDNERADELAGAARRKLKGEPEKKKRKKRDLFAFLDKVEPEALREALEGLSKEAREKLRRFLVGKSLCGACSDAGCPPCSDEG